MARRGDDVDDEFGDDDAFDQLPPNTLYQLEEQAFLSTQRPRSAGVQPRLQAKQQHAQPPSSEYGSADYDEEDVIDLNAEPITLPSAHGLPTRTGHGHHNGPFRPPSKTIGTLQHPTRIAAAAPVLKTLNGSQAGQHSQASPRDDCDDIDVQALLAQVENVCI